MRSEILGCCVDMIEGFPAVDLQTAANNGDWISLKNAQQAAIVFVSGLGTAAQDPTITVEQASDVAGTGAKALNFTKIYRKQAATSLAAVSAWTETTQAAANTYTNGTAAEEDLIWWIEINPATLDLANGFDCIRATVADVGGAAQPGYLFYLVCPKNMRAPANSVSYIAD